MAAKDDIKSVKQDIVKLEHKMDDNHKALYDGYQQSIEGINVLTQESAKWRIDWSIKKLN